MTKLETIRAQFLEAAQAGDFDIGDVDSWAGRIAPLLQLLEASHHQGVLDLSAALTPHDPDMAASLAARTYEAVGVTAGEFDMADTDNDLAFCLYWMHDLPPDVMEAIRAHAFLKQLWPLVMAAAPEPVITAAEMQAITGLAAKQKLVLATEDGTVLGTHKYEQLDPGWLWAPVNRILNWWQGPAKFRHASEFAPIALSPRTDTGTEGTVKVAIIGDWGTGTYAPSAEGDGQQAAEVLKTANSLNPDYIIHLGDTYYAGTGSSRPPANEERDNLTTLWASLTPGFPKDRFFTLNSNHEMYGGAYGLYAQALDQPLFAAQGGVTYFALQFKNWLLGGIDSAYYSDSITYLKGGLGKPDKHDPQYGFLQDFKAYADAGGMTTLLMSHHNPITTFADGLFGSLWDDVTGTGTLTPDYWYWGHIHLGAVYADDAPIWQQLGISGKIKARCVGHSAIPVATPWGFSEPEHADAASWWAATPKNPPVDTDKFPVQRAARIKNGFAMITLSEGSIVEAIYDEGSTTPVWTSG